MLIDPVYIPSGSFEAFGPIVDLHALAKRCSRGRKTCRVQAPAFNGDELPPGARVVYRGQMSHTEDFASTSSPTGGFLMQEGAADGTAAASACFKFSLRQHRYFRFAITGQGVKAANKRAVCSIE